MARQKDALKKIVALKRQSAEQKVRALQIEVEQIEAAINALLASLDSAGQARFGYEALSLAATHGHVGKVLADVRQRREALVARREDLHLAREALKRVFHSEERLNQAP